MPQPKCKAEGCPRTAIPGKSPHGLCLKHEAELEDAARKCPFPGCQGRQIPGRNPHGCCFDHEKFLSDLLFILPQIQRQPPRSKGGLVLPGSPEFSVLQKNTG